MYQGRTIRIVELDAGFVELCFDREQAAINKMDRQMTQEFAEVVALLAARDNLRGVL